MPPPEENVHETVAAADDGRLLPEVLELDEPLDDALAEGVLLLEAEEVAVVGVEAVLAEHPTTPTIAAADSPPRKALRVTTE